MTSDAVRVKGVRRGANALSSLPVGDLPLLRRYEILFTDDTRRVTKFHQVDSSLDGRASPADFRTTMDEVQRAFAAQETRFVQCVTGQLMPDAET